MITERGQSHQTTQRHTRSRTLISSQLSINMAQVLHWLSCLLGRPWTFSQGFRCFEWPTQKSYCELYLCENSLNETWGFMSEHSLCAVGVLLWEISVCNEPKKVIYNCSSAGLLQLSDVWRTEQPKPFSPTCSWGQRHRNMCLCEASQLVLLDNMSH